MRRLGLSISAQSWSGNNSWTSGVAASQRAGVAPPRNRAFRQAVTKTPCAKNVEAAARDHGARPAHVHGL